MIAWFRGSLLPSDSAVLSLQDRGFLLGDGVFDTLLISDKKLLSWEAHCQRLQTSACVLKIPLDFDDLQKGMANICDEVTAASSPMAVRITLTRGPSTQRGLNIPASPQPTLLITAHPYTPPSQPWRAIISAHQRPPNLLSRHKTLHYLPAILALDDAQSRGYDEALLTNARKDIVCATRGNVFILQGKYLFTPPISSGALPGITRACVLRIASTRGLSLRVTPLSHQMMAQADAAFVTNSLIGLHPLASLGEFIYPGSGYVSQLKQACLEKLREG